MNARMNEATISPWVNIEERATEATNRARYAMLNELPGVVFGFLTLAWIVTSARSGLSERINHARRWKRSRFHGLRAS